MRFSTLFSSRLFTRNNLKRVYGTIGFVYGVCTLELSQESLPNAFNRMFFWPAFMFLGHAESQQKRGDLKRRSLKKG